MAGEPHLETSSIYGSLEVDRTSTISIVLHNNATPQDELDLNRADASSITAELESSDDRIRVLSGIQMAGTLAPGENETVQFMVQTESADVGIYPLLLRLNYSKLSKVTISGEDSAPDIVFSYQEVSQDIPLQVKVVRGPKIELKELKGEATVGREASLEVAIVNNGDEPANDLRVEASPRPPFLRAGNENVDVDLAPGDSYLVRLSIFTDENATPGYNPLPIRISYQDPEQSGRTSQDLALLVMVGKDAYSVTWLLLPAGLLLLAGGYYGQKKIAGQKEKTAPNHEGLSSEKNLEEDSDETTKRLRGQAHELLLSLFQNFLLSGYDSLAHEDLSIDNGSVDSSGHAVDKMRENICLRAEPGFSQIDQGQVCLGAFKKPHIHAECFVGILCGDLPDLVC